MIQVKLTALANIFGHIIYGGTPEQQERSGNNMGCTTGAGLTQQEAVDSALPTLLFNGIAVDPTSVPKPFVDGCQAKNIHGNDFTLYAEFY